MKKESELLKLFLDAAGCDINMSTFDGRLEVQKTTYLIQEMGYNLGYNYHWYLRGPYCSEVADAAFEISRNKQEYDHLQSSLKSDIQEDVESKFKKFNDEKPELLTEIDWYELLASTTYIAHNLGKDDDKDDKIVEQLLDKKKWYQPDDAKKALRLLHEVNIV